jgi:hypothetical protein
MLLYNQLRVGFQPLRAALSEVVCALEANLPRRSSLAASESILTSWEGLFEAADIAAFIAAITRFLTF